MSEISDVIGLELEEARRRLQAAGWSAASVTETRPPQAVELFGSFRVVRIRHRSDGSVDLVVTRERYTWPGA